MREAGIVPDVELFAQSSVQGDERDIQSEDERARDAGL